MHAGFVFCLALFGVSSSFRQKVHAGFGVGLAHFGVGSPLQVLAWVSLRIGVLGVSL